jgi:hypothetical protein
MKVKKQETLRLKKNSESPELERATTTELIDLVPSATTADDFILKMCGGELCNLLDGLSRLLIWYAHHSAGRHIQVTHMDLIADYVRMSGAVGDVMRALDPRTLVIVSHMMSHYLHTGSSPERAVKKVIDEAYSTYCQLM